MDVLHSSGLSWIELDRDVLSLNCVGGIGVVSDRTRFAMIAVGWVGYALVLLFGRSCDKRCTVIVLVKRKCASYGTERVDLGPCKYFLVLHVSFAHLTETQQFVCI